MITFFRKQFVGPAISVALAITLSSAAHAAITAVRVDQVDPGTLVPDHTTNRVFIDFTDTAADPRLTGQMMVIILSAGSIFQVDFSGDTPPDASLINVFPVLAFDTFVALGGLTAQDSYPVRILGPATLSICTELICPAPGLGTDGGNIAWTTETGVSIPPADNFVIAQLTLSNDAAGIIQYYGSTADGSELILPGSIAGGVITLIPEPGSAVLTALAMIGSVLACRRRVPVKATVVNLAPLRQGDGIW